MDVTKYWVEEDETQLCDVADLEKLIKIHGNKKSVMEIIKMYFQMNNLETEAISMISDLAASAASKNKKELHDIKGNLANVALANYSTYFEPKVVADLLTSASCYVTANENIHPMILKELAYQIPQIALGSKPIWVPLLEVLHANGIYFKDEESR